MGFALTDPPSHQVLLRAMLDPLPPGSPPPCSTASSQLWEATCLPSRSYSGNWRVSQSGQRVSQNPKSSSLPASPAAPWHLPACLALSDSRAWGRLLGLREWDAPASDPHAGACHTGRPPTLQPKEPKGRRRQGLLQVPTKCGPVCQSGIRTDWTMWALGVGQEHGQSS